ncbi:unnamed protein product [Owenia fusiformis]|uniref:Uncharacterized protein n=1 Tax=Owenia fusiformis TaxID=6347 RepID=A0A8J1U7C6_OWEFU|nr:unnamed protein product [Owenia fusiformis]
MERSFLYFFLFIGVAWGAVPEGQSNIPRAVWGQPRVEQAGSRPVQYEHFEDYLIANLDPAQIERERTRGPNRSNTRQHVSNATTTPSTELVEEATNRLDILGYFKDVPRRHWSCCMLGKLAGDKGFHCHAQFYAARISMRNRNRAHNAKMHFNGRWEIPNYGKELMLTFSRCVDHRHRGEFNKCCYAAATERTERERWQIYRWNTDTNSTNTEGIDNTEESQEDTNARIIVTDSPQSQRQQQQRDMERQRQREMRRQSRQRNRQRSRRQ